jgi:hypothetical protein
VLPGPVGLDGRAIEVPGLEFVEAGFDQNRDLPAVQSDVDRLPGAQKACADGQVHGHVGELRAEGTRLYSPPGSQRDWARRVAAEHVRGVRCRLGVAGEDEQPEYLSRHRRPPSPGTQRVERPSAARSGMHACPGHREGRDYRASHVSGGASSGEVPKVSRCWRGRRTLIDGGPASLMGWPRWNDLKNRRFCSDVAVSAR